MKLSEMMSQPKRLLERAQDGLERRVRSEHHEVNLQPSRLWAKTITWCLVGGSLFGVGWLAFAQTEEIVVAQGKIEPIGSVKEIQIPVQGVVEEILVRDGEKVKAGQTLIRLDTEASRQGLKSARQVLQLRQQELELKQQELLRTEELTATQIGVYQRTLRLNREILARYEALAKEGATAELQYLEQKNKVEELTGKIEQTEVDSRRQVSILNQNIRALRSQIADSQKSITELEVTLRYQAIQSPSDGVVFDLKPKARGFVAQGSEAVMKIVPSSTLQAKVEIPSSDIGFVSVGKPVDISIDSFPASDFGVVEGRLSRIGSDALPPDPATQKLEYRFPADISLDSQQLKLKNGTTLPLQVGMSLTANIKLRKVTYLQLLLSDFKDKADSLRRQ